MKTCFVSIPFGIKTDLYSGMQIDFDNIYQTLIIPAIAGTKVSVFRFDDVADNTNMQRSIVESVISSDIMIVDLTTQNPNVMYELGMRHMAQRGLTIMICSSGTRIPSNIANFRVISYELNADGNVTEASKHSFHQLLRYSIESNLEQTVADSPVYQFFPDIKVILPDNLMISESKRQSSRKTFTKKAAPYVISSNWQQSNVILKDIQSEALNDPETVDPIEFIKLLKNYRDISAWKDLVSLAEAIPDNMKKSPEVQQLYALALNRLGEQEKAIAIMEQLIVQTGGDSESYGILGRIYKDRYESSKNSKNQEMAKVYLDKAILNYRAGFDKQPGDYYTGVNVVNLLTQKQDAESEKELSILLPKVSEALNNKMKDGIPDYWDHATALELSCIAKEWDKAEEQVKQVTKLSNSGWMIETTVNNLNILLSVVRDDNDRSNLKKIISMLKEMNVPAEGLRHA